MKKTPKTPLSPELLSLKRSISWQFYTVITLVVILGLLVILSLNGQAGLSQALDKDQQNIKQSLQQQQTLLTQMQQTLAKQNGSTDNAIQQLGSTVKQDNQQLLQRIAQQQTQQNRTLQHFSTQLTQSVSKLKTIETHINNSTNLKKQSRKGVFF